MAVLYVCMGGGGGGGGGGGVVTYGCECIVRVYVGIVCCLYACECIV